MKRKDELNYPHQTDSDFFGFTSDWHIGNKHTNEDYILDYLDLLKERGVKQIEDYYQDHIGKTPKNHR